MNQMTLKGQHADACCFWRWLYTFKAGLHPVYRHRDEEVKQELEPCSLDQRAKHVNTGVNVEVEKSPLGYKFILEYKSKLLIKYVCEATSVTLMYMTFSQAAESVKRH